MDIPEILKAFAMESGPFPKEAVGEAIRLQEEITPELLSILQDTVEGAEQGTVRRDDTAPMSHLFAIYLLALFREPRAYPLVVRFARLPEDTLGTLAGDFITEDLGRVLASVSGGDLSLLESLVEDTQAYEYSRGSCVEAFKILVAEGAVSRDEVVSYYKALFNGRLERSNSQVWNDLVSCATRLHPAEMYNDIVDAYEEGLFEDGYVPLDSIHNVMKMDRGKVLTRLKTATRGFIRDLVQDMAWYACFKDRPIVSPRVRENTEPVARRLAEIAPGRAVKFGPNDPCSCGSGRKYKKCCGRNA